MRVRLLLGGLVVASVWLVLKRGIAPLLVWELAVAILLALVLYRSRPRAPAPVRPMILANPGFPPAPHYELAALEIEVADALDPRLGGDERLRRRLRRLAANRAGGEATTVGAIPPATGMTARAASGGSLDLDEIELLVEEIENL